MSAPGCSTGLGVSSARTCPGSPADLFSCRAPDAGAICYVCYGLDINSTELAERLRAEKGVLLVPGDHFGMDRYLRIAFGNPAAELEEALDRVAALLEEAYAAVA